MIPAAVAAALVFGFGCEQASSPLNAAENQSPPTKTVEEIRDQTLVTVNGQAVTGEMFGIYLNERMQKSPGAKNTPQMQNQAINELINIMLLAQAASEAGLDKRPNVVTALNLQRDQFLSRVALQEHVATHQPSEEELKKSYDESVGNQEGEEYKARHILVKTEEEAKKLIEEINGGADFAELAKEHSTGPTGVKGGDLGWFDGGQMVKPFADAVKTAEIGMVTPTPVETQFGWHVIELQEKRAKQPPSFESVRQKLLGEAQRKSLGEYMNQLREKAKIEINEELSKKPEAADAAPPAIPAETK
jgi:peptidyl-prolyl cis-trans isomerase C